MTSRGAPHQEHVGVQRLRNEMAAADQLDRVDILLRQQAPHADGEGDRDDDRHHQVVVARHLEDHGDGGHGGAGAAADHGGHADHGEGSDAEALDGMDGVDQQRRRRRRWSRP